MTALFIFDTFSNEIYDFLCASDVDNMAGVMHATTKMYKITFLENCITFPKDFYVECSYCGNISRGRSRKKSYICFPCTEKMITIHLL